MIYEKITEVLENYLGDGFRLSNQYNHDFKWEDIVPSEQDKLSYGVLRVDSGNTLQVSDKPVRVEQLRLIVAIPENRAIFNEAVTKLRSMLKGLNDYIVNDADENAVLIFGEYQDSASQTINGNRWWIANVVFAANFYQGFALAENIEISVQTGTDSQTSQPIFTNLSGLISANYLREFGIDSSVANSNPIPYNFVNSIKRNLTITLVCLSSDTLISSLLTNENTSTKYTIKYNNSIVTRTFDAILANINENAVIGDVIKMTLSFVQTS